MKPGVTQSKEQFHSYTTPAYVPGFKSIIPKKTMSDLHSSQPVPTRPNSNLSNAQFKPTETKSTPSTKSNSSNPWSKPSKKKPVAKEESANSQFLILKKKK